MRTETDLDGATVAAIERRESVTDSNHIGNAAAMREALEAFVESVEWLCEGDESGRLKQQFGVLLSAARAALSAPARNCDVYQTNDDAWRSYQLSHAEGKVIPDYIDWLFALAAERKGED